ncbi:MAG: hypothetical protein WBD10_07945 [Acidobacteriaceae bacterium]
MVSTSVFSRTLLSRFAIAASALALLALPCAVQAQASTASEGGQQYSSSSDWKAYLTSYDFDGAPGASASPQYGQYGRRNNSPYPYQSRWSHMAFEVGGGFTAPVGNAARNWETWGYNVNVGAGWNFSKYFGALVEYQFNRMKIPGHTLTDLAVSNGIPQLGGNINTWSLTLDPIIYLPVSHSFGTYVTGGGGFYRKVTNFTESVLSTQCDPYYGFCYSGYVPTTVAHSSSNQLGANLGFGLYWKAFGDSSNAKLYTEARYVWVNSPESSASDPYGSGTEGFIPVTVGLRF